MCLMLAGPLTLIQYRCQFGFICTIFLYRCHTVASYKRVAKFNFDNCTRLTAVSSTNLFYSCESYPSSALASCKLHPTSYTFTAFFPRPSTGCWIRPLALYFGYQYKEHRAKYSWNSRCYCYWNSD